MIIVKCDDEAAATAAIEKALRGTDVEILQSDTEDYTTEEIMAVLMYNTTQGRKYIGRLERNTRSIDANLRQVAKLLEPLATYLTIKMVEEGDDPKLLENLRRAREAQVMRENLITPKIGEKAATIGE
jgi:hypothetical protein